MGAAEPRPLVNVRDEGRRRDRPALGTVAQPSDSGVGGGEGSIRSLAYPSCWVPWRSTAKSGAISESKRPGSGKVRTRWLKRSGAPVRMRQLCWRRRERMTEM